MNPCLSNVPRDNVYSLFHRMNHLHQMDMITNGAALKFHKRYPDQEVEIDIPDEFVVGYGLDYDQKYRNLPYIGFVEIEE